MMVIVKSRLNELRVKAVLENLFYRMLPVQLDVTSLEPRIHLAHIEIEWPHSPRIGCGE